MQFILILSSQFLSLVKIHRLSVMCCGHFIKHDSHSKVNNVSALNIKDCSTLEEKEEHYEWIYTIRFRNSTCQSMKHLLLRLL
jgi:hypothetical protein